MIKIDDISSEIFSLHHEKGFDYRDRVPRLEMGLPERLVSQRLSLKVLYDPESDCIYVNPEAINTTSGDLKKARRMSEDPDFAKKVKPLTDHLLNAGPLYDFTSDTEFRSMISRAFGFYLLHHTILRERSDSWLRTETSKPNEKFAIFLIREGIGEFFAQLAVRASEAISADIWGIHGKNPAIPQTGGLTFWARAGCTIVKPILKDFPRVGLLYLLTYPLCISEDFALESVPLYRATALGFLDDTQPV